MYNYRTNTTTTTAPPIPNGDIIWNNAIQTASTILYVSHINSDNQDVEVLLASIPVGTTLTIQDKLNSANNQVWTITSVTPTPNTLVAFGVSLLSSTHLFSNNNPLLLITQTVGNTGAQGSQGFTGDTGAQGYTGDTGAQGLQGFTGATGAQGPQGDTGETGATGPQGAPGSIGTYDQVLAAGNTAIGQTADITGGTTLGTATSSVSNTSILITDTDLAATSIFQAIYTIKGLSYTSNTPSGSDSLAISLNNTGVGGSSGIFHDDFYTPPSNFMISTTGELNLLGVTVVAPTPTPATLSDTQVATTAFVQNAITEVGGSNTYNQVLTNGNTATDKSAVITGVGVIGTVSNINSKFNNNIRDTNGTAYKESFVQNNNFYLGATNGTVSESLTLQLDGGGTGTGLCGVLHTDGYATKTPLTIQTPLQLNIDTPVIYVPSNTASSVISVSQTLGIGLVNTVNQTGLSYTGLTTGLNTGGSCNVNAVGTMDATNKGAGYTLNPQLTLTNSNTTAGNTTGVPSVELFKSGRNGATNDVVSALNFFARDGAGAKQFFGGIETTITSAGGGGGVDGALDFYSCVNGSGGIGGKSLVFRMNGADNENNSFRPLDMNGQTIRTSTGNLTIEASTSTGVGDIIVASKGSTIISSLGTASITTNTGNITFSSAASSGTGDITASAKGKINLTAVSGSTTAPINSLDLSSGNTITLTNGNEFNGLPENQIIMTATPAGNNNQIAMSVNNDGSSIYSRFYFGLQGSQFSICEGGGAGDGTNVWNIPADNIGNITMYRSLDFTFGSVTTGYRGVLEKSIINSTTSGNFDITSSRFNTIILTPTGALTADISTPVVVGYWWGVCNKSTTQSITIRLNGVNQITIPATTNPLVGTTIRVAAASTTSLYLI